MKVKLTQFAIRLRSKLEQVDDGDYRGHAYVMIGRMIPEGGISKKLIDFKDPEIFVEVKNNRIMDISFMVNGHALPKISLIYKPEQDAYIMEIDTQIDELDIWRILYFKVTINGVDAGQFA